ncbi:MAG: hypothetical protein V1839_02925, partial [archaeon]
MAMTEAQYKQEVVLPKKMSDLEAIVENFGTKISQDLLSSWKDLENLQAQMGVLDKAEKTPAAVLLRKLDISYCYNPSKPYFENCAV